MVSTQGNVYHHTMTIAQFVRDTTVTRLSPVQYVSWVTFGVSASSLQDQYITSSIPITTANDEHMYVGDRHEKPGV